MTPSDIQVLENNVVDLQIALDDVNRELEQVSKRAIRIMLQLDIAKQKLNAAQAERGHETA